MLARAKAFGFAVAAFLALATTLSPAESSGTEYEVVPEEIKAAPWSVSLPHGDDQPLQGRTIFLSISSGYCLGEPKPRFDHMKVVEQPKTKRRPFKSSVVTIFLRRPAYERPVRPPNTDKVIYNACAGLGLIIQKRIKLKRPAADLRFFDGSFSPPRRVQLPK